MPEQYRAGVETPGPFTRAYLSATGGVGILGRYGLKQERRLTDQLIEQVRADDSLSGLDPVLDLGSTKMTREQHQAYRSGLVERASTQQVANEGFSALGEQLANITPRSQSDLEQLAVFKTRLDLAQRYAGSVNPQVQSAGMSELLSLGKELSDFSATNEAQGLQEETVKRAIGTERWSRFAGLADDYRTETAAIRQRQSAWQIMQAASYQPDRAGDVGRINAFMHIIEPNSIVMPGEAANVAGLNGVPGILVTGIARVMNDGGVLTGDDRRMLDMFARKVMVDSNKELSSINQRYAAQARGGEVPDSLAQTMFIDPASIEATGNERFSAPPKEFVPTATDEPSGVYEAGSVLNRGLKQVFGEDVPDFLRGLTGLDPKPETYTAPSGEQMELVDLGGGRREWRPVGQQRRRGLVSGTIQRGTDEF